MNSVDVLFLVLLAACGVLGLYWGVIRQVLALAGLLAGVVLASRYGPAVSDALLPFARSVAVANSAGFIIVLLLVSGIASLLATVLRRFVGLLFLGWLDHLIGGVLGLLQAALLGTVLLAVALTFPNAGWIDAVRAAQITPLLLRAFGAVLLLLPAPYRFAANLVFDAP